MAKLFRKTFEESQPRRSFEVSDSELLDCFSYSLYPNMFIFPVSRCPWLSLPPGPQRPRKSTMEVLFLRPSRPTAARSITPK